MGDVSSYIARASVNYSSKKKDKLTTTGPVGLVRPELRTFFGGTLQSEGKHMGTWIIGIYEGYIRVVDGVIIGMEYIGLYCHPWN